jgi:phosphohistidine swiveling domain-containing protein
MFVIPDHEADLSGSLGGKARALAALRAADLPIPPWFVVPPAAFDASLPPEQPRDPTALADLQPSLAVQLELKQALAELCPHGQAVAVRSSASDEDGPQHSFAGQLESFLFVPPGEVAARVADVWRSGFSERIVAYRQKNNLPLPPRPPAVLVQRMVNADVAGVAFGADPVGGRRSVAVVAAVLGLGSALVSGEADGDTYHVDRDGNIVGQRIVPKRLAQRAGLKGSGLRTMAVSGDQANRPALTDEQVRQVAELVRRAGDFYQRPQDIEWAIEGGQLYLLQARPITALADLPDPDGAVTLWDNSNIAESYNGVTTPLTFSFARRAYEEVYRQFCKILRVPVTKLDQNADVFPRMLGLIRGRIYYNLLSWYRTLALLPGFTFNRRFMEQMMGVKEGLPESVAASLGRAGWREWFADSFHFLGSCLALAGNHFGINRQIRRFYQRLDQALGPGRPDFSRLRPDELVAVYRDLERQLLTRWDAPLVNDFFAMIFHGVLRRMTAKWFQDDAGSLANDLLGGEGGMVSAEPPARVRRMALLAAGKPKLIAALSGDDRAAMMAALEQEPELAGLFREYLDKFGDRCLEELKLESPTLHDNPLPLLQAVGQLARRWAERAGPAASFDESSQRRQAEERVRDGMRYRPVRRWLLGWVLRNARARVRDRENLRFERTRLFGRVRQIFVAMGQQLFALDRLAEPRDIFYLEVAEILGFIDGTGTCTDLRSLAALRKAEFERYRQMERPPDRFETRGAAHVGLQSLTRSAEESVVHSADSRKGLGACAGVVRGPVRVVTDPRTARLQLGEILVAERTDPGWIVLFAAAAGLVVERGSLLSHAAIVAREMGLPAVVSVDGATRWLKDGDWVELDGRSGMVTKVKA